MSDEKNILQINSSSAVQHQFRSRRYADNTDKLISLKFLDPTWIQLRDNEDNIIISKLMNKGDEYSYDLSKKLYSYCW